MCKLSPLEHNEHGYVATCSNCRCWQVAFGNTILSFRQDQFNAFLRSVENRLKDQCLMEQEGVKCIHLSTAHRCIQLVFTQEELYQLHHLLDMAVAGIEIKKLLETDN